MTGTSVVVRINTQTDLRTVQRQQMRTVQIATADLIASATLLEKALDGNIDDDVRRLVNAAYFQVNQVQETFEKLAAQIDNVTLEG